MCGIAGILKKNVTIDYSVIDEVLSSIKHRGPDGSGYKRTDDAILFHTRLSIVDLSEKASQPFTNDNNLFIVYNGEIYNYKILKKELESDFEFISSSDTEVILNSYKKWGEECVCRFDGMFSFMIYDATSGNFFCAVDKLGKKPFYYTHTNSAFIFASEIKAIQPLSKNQPKLSIQGVNQFLSLGYTLAPDTIFQDIYSLEPGTCIQGNIYQNKLVKKAYFQLSTYFSKSNDTSYEASATAVRHYLEEAVKKRIDSDVEVGILLSGGLDSSIIAALASKNPNITKTFTIGFKNGQYDEHLIAQKTSKKLGLENQHIVLSPPSGNYVHQQITQMDQPFADNSWIACRELAKLTSKSVKVVLSGDGGDELFAGYPTLKADYLNEKYYSIFSVLKKIYPNKKAANDGMGWKTKANRFVSGINKDYRYAHYSWRQIFSPLEIIQILGDKYAEEIIETNPFKKFVSLYDEIPEFDHIKQHMYVDMKTWLSNDILVKVDRASMQYGLEVRSPFLDDDLVEFCCSLPSNYKFHPLQNKSLLKDAFRANWGADFINKPKKGFNVPIGEWANTREDEFKYYTKLIFNELIKPHI